MFFSLSSTSPHSQPVPLVVVQGRVDAGDQVHGVWIHHHVVDTNSHIQFPLNLQHATSHLTIVLYILGLAYRAYIVGYKYN